MFKGQPLPKFQPIALEYVPRASILLYYGGTKITEIVGEWLYHHPYHPPAFHASGYIGNFEHLNVGPKITTIQDVRQEFLSTRRVDVIILKDITEHERDVVCTRFRRDAGMNVYDAMGYLHFGGKLKILRFLKKIKANENDDFCSDNVVDNFSKDGISPRLKKILDSELERQLLTLDRDIPVSNFPSEDTAPWHLLEYAIAHPDTREVRTLHTGTDFKS